MDEFNKAYKEFLKDVNDSNDLDQDFINFINDDFLDILVCGFVSLEKE